MNIKISDKEQTRIKSATAYYKDQGHEVEVTNLQIGDYIFNNQVVFEFKTIADFVASIQDSRVFNEAINQAENFDYHFVIIQGDEATRAKALAMSRNYHEITYFGYLGAISSLNRYTTVIESYSPHIHEAYYRMMITAKKCLQNKPIVKKFNRKHKNSAMNYLTYCVYGLNWKRSHDIVTLLELNTLEDLLNVTHQQLTSVPGIGEKMADRIIDTLNNDTYES
jgi:ERCC4-type nuclease